MFEDLENVEVTIGMWLFVLACLWIVPDALGMKTWNIFFGIMVSVLSLPLCYLIINGVANR